MLNGNEPPKPVLAGSETQRLIANMERWRWMPEELGDFHVWDNIPEFIARVFKKGQVIHTAKIVVGKVENPTAVFSANMRYIVFQPEWGVPDGIKLKEIAPYLRSGGGGFLASSAPTPRSCRGTSCGSASTAGRSIPARSTGTRSTSAASRSSSRPDPPTCSAS